MKTFRLKTTILNQITKHTSHIEGRNQYDEKKIITLKTKHNSRLAKQTQQSKGLLNL